MYMHTYTQTYTYTYTYIYTCTYTHIHAHTYTYAGTYLRSIHTLGVDTVIMLLYVTNNSSSIRLNNEN